MGGAAFFLTEKNQYDLVYHRGLYDTLQEGGLEAAIQYSLIDKSPLYIGLEYILSFFRDNRLASAVPTFLGYFILVYLLGKTSQKYKVSKRTNTIFLIFLLFILPWHDYSAGIRGALAYSLGCLGLYVDVKSKNTVSGVLLYISALFIHQAAIIIIALRLMLLLIEKFPFMKNFCFILCLSLGSITEILSPILTSLSQMTGLSILGEVSHSFENYVVKGKELYEYSIVFLRIIAILVIYFVTKSSSQYKERDEQSIYTIYTMLMLVTIGYIWQYDIVCRYSFACMVISTLILYRCKKHNYAVLLLFSLFNIICYYNIYYKQFEIIIR